MIEFTLISLLGLPIISEDLSKYFKPSAAKETIQGMQDKRRKHNIEVIRQSIQNNLKKPFHDFSYEDIIRCAKKACWLNTSQAIQLTQKALEQLGLKPEDFRGISVPFEKEEEIDNSYSDDWDNPIWLCTPSAYSIKSIKRLSELNV